MVDTANHPDEEHDHNGAHTQKRKEHHDQRKRLALTVPVAIYCPSSNNIRRPVAKNETFSYRSSYRFSSYPLKILLDADIGKVHTQRIRDRQDDSDRLPLSMHLTDSCERRNSVSKCTPEWDEKVSFLATGRHMHKLTHRNELTDLIYEL